MKLALGLYGFYLLMVAIRGQGEQLTTALQQDAPGFLPWLIAAGTLGALYEWDKTRSLAALFLLLVVLTFVLKNFAGIKAQFAPIYRAAVAGPQNPVTSKAPSVLPPLGVAP